MKTIVKSIELSKDTEEINENEIDRKPGSVLNDDLSRPAIADRFVPPSGHASSAVRPI